MAAAWLGCAAGVAAPQADTVRARQALAALDVPFEGNVGQYDARVAFAARTFAGTTFVTHEGLIVHALHASRPGPERASGWNLVESLVGAAAHPSATAPSATRVTRLTGRYQGDIPTFSTISLGEAWPGIEVSLRAKGANVEKLFTVSPGADAARIRVSVSGARSLRVDESGALVAETQAGGVRFTAPIAWQRIGAERRFVTVSYVTEDAEYGFRLGAHDPTVAVVIDPLLQSTYLGGGSPFDTVSGMAVGSTVYVAGSTSSFDFPGTTGGAQPAPNLFDSYVANLSADLTQLNQATYLGGGGSDSITALALDAVGNVYVAGSTQSANFPASAGGAQAAFGGGASDGFVAKLSADLKSIIQATYLGGGASDEVTAITFDVAAGQVLVAGTTQSDAFPGVSGSAQASRGGNSDAFVSRLSADLKTLVRSTYFGGANDDSSRAIAVATGIVYLGGRTASGPLPGVTGGAQANLGGLQDGFVAGFSSDLVTLAQATYLGGFDADSVEAIALGAGGAVYVAGSTSSLNFPATTGGAQPASTGSAAFVAQLAADLKSIAQATYLGGNGSSSASALVLDATGNVFVAGGTSATNLPGTSGRAAASTGDAFVARLAGNLKTLTRAMYLGGSASDFATRMVLDPFGNLVVAGGTESSDFPGTTGGAITSNGFPGFGVGGAFVTRITTDLLPGPAARFELTAPASVAMGASFNVTVNAVDATGSVATSYAGTLKWTSSDATATLPANGTIANGTGTFPVTLRAAGLGTVTVTDTVNASITGSRTITVSGQPATNFTITAPASVAADQLFDFTVTARNSLGNIAADYAGSVSLTSSDPAAQFPSGGTVGLTSGQATFQGRLKTAGTATITATDLATPSITGTSPPIPVTPQLHFVVSAPAGSAAGAAFNAVVTSRDPANNVYAGYSGTVRITSSDGAAVLPPNATLTNGTGTFAVTLKTLGNQSVTASDTVDPLVTAGSATVAVAPGPTVALSVAAPSSATANTAFSFTVTARDAFGNATPTYAGTIGFTSSDGAATLPASSALVAGTGSFSATLKTLGSRTITATASAAPSITGTSNPILVSQLVTTAASIDFGGQSMGTTSPPSTLTVTNTSGAPVTITDVTVSNPQFLQTNDCATLAAGSTCTITVRFKPAVTTATLGASVAVSGTLAIASAAGNMATALAGQAEKSLVTHYYRSILRRAPDSGGKTFWEAEAARGSGLGINVNETWFAMAMTFYSSAEYKAFNRDNAAFVTDLYTTFFNRAPDAGGLTYWTGNLNSGMPREVALAEFMFSTEFRTLAQSIFGNTAVRAEIGAVTDFYRGLLARLPDTAGFGVWLARFRTAQCQGAAQVNAEAESISSAFTRSAEYTARNRTNAQFVGDLYNAFLRRGGDLAGVNSWITQLNTSLPRDTVRIAFKNSPEFQARVNAIIQQGCLP